MTTTTNLFTTTSPSTKPPRRRTHLEYDIHASDTVASPNPLATTTPSTKPPRRRTHLEYDIQTDFFVVIRKLERVDERWGLIYSVPNAAAQSRRSRLHEYRLGLHRGVADVAVDLPSSDHSYGYLRIEFKTPTGSQSPDQRHYQHLVTSYGSGLYVVCRSVDEAFSTLATYLGLDRDHFLDKVKSLRPKRKGGKRSTRGTNVAFCL